MQASNRTTPAESAKPRLARPLETYDSLPEGCLEPTQDKTFKPRANRRLLPEIFFPRGGWWEGLLMVGKS